MKITIQPPLSGSSKQLNDYIVGELNTFSNANKGFTTVDVRLRQEKIFTADNKVCEIYLGMFQKNIFAVQKARTYEEAVLKSIEKLRRHLKNIAA